MKSSNGHIVAGAIEIKECGLPRFGTTVCLLAYLAILVGGLCSRVSAQSCSDEVIKQNRAATVFIKVKKTLKVTGQVEERTGTGFIISPSGYVLTNKHVIDADEKVDETTIIGAIASREEASASRLTLIDANRHDVALLKFADTSKTYKTVALGQVTDVKVGTHLCSEGFPQDKEYFFAEGPISGTGAERGFWFTQMPSNPGDSGAPVFLNSGEVVAIKVGGYEGLQNVNLLIPMNFAQDLLNEVPDVPRPSVPVPDQEDKRRLQQALDNERGELADRAFSRGVVLVNTFYDDEQTHPMQSGLGLIVETKPGYLIVNAHMVANARRILVNLSKGDSRLATVVGVDLNSDIAVVTVDSSIQVAPAKFGDSDDLHEGDRIEALCLTERRLIRPVPGTILAPGRPEIRDRLGNVIQTASPILTIAAGSSDQPAIVFRGAEVMGIKALGSTSMPGLVPGREIVDIFNQLIGPTHTVLRALGKGL